MNRDLFDAKPELHRMQDAMARNIAKLKNKDAKRAQVSILCRSLVAMMKARRPHSFHSRSHLR
ncbi:hypothetical protein KMC49_gp04 [Ralstonia phage Firinga]|uniref:Uncharacterized protein n=2 Tax=Firingavirus firinga TaxID=2846043 RepID=A0A7G5B9U9_9CAUD|nr:hypothetical protein KMC49_gp04 [Ralstonia phage Firinga]QMV33072.1 hypothetical protein 18C_00004 [Ralstonia phage Firinga]QMV33334.1 hypothetical protein 12C_00024 [Ralstonia phage Hennie]